MMPLRGRALRAQWRTLQRTLASKPPLPRTEGDGDGEGNSAPREATELTGSAKLFADAAAEERAEADAAAKSSRAHLVDSQGPIWTGEEAQSDTVLRMLVDKYKPLRTGEGIKDDAAEKRIRNWMKNLDMASRAPLSSNIITASSGESPHAPKLPPHLFRPWHATYTGDNEVFDSPKIKLGHFESRPPTDISDLMELRLPSNADGTVRKAHRDFRRSTKLQGRLGNARESAIDYRLGIHDGDMTHVGAEEEEMEGFSGNRQIRGQSVLGAQRGSASGMRAWAGLVEERISAAQSKGFFKNLKGAGKPIERDPSETNPLLGLSEVYMNRIIKRQGALPPWIELQNNLNSSQAAFRSQLLDSYTKHMVRSILASNPIDLLPTYEQLPGRDEAFEARNDKFHRESVRQLNDTLGKMNAQAPMPSRRGMIQLEHELDRVRGDVLRHNVWDELQKRVLEIKELEAKGPATGRLPFLQTLENGAFARLGRRMGALVSGSPTEQASSGGTGGNGTNGGGTLSDNGHPQAGGGKGLLIFAGLTLVVVLYLRKPTLNESPMIHDDLIPVREPSEKPFVALSPSEPSVGVLELLREYVLEPFLTLVRFIHLALLFCPVIITSPMIFVGTPPRRKPGKPIAETEENWGAVWWYGFLVKQMERAGPTFIKLGQWAASRADLFPEALCIKMSKLHSSNRPHPFWYTKRVLERAFGLPLDEIFAELEDTPIGCGAIAQVYRAQLRPEILQQSSEEAAALAAELAANPDRQIVTTVAIKVLHPRVEKLVRRDIRIMSLFAKVINALPDMEWLSLPDEVTVFGDMMNQQLDLRVEASNLDRFRDNFADRPRTVTFPRPIRLGPDHIAATKQVLVEEYEDALPLKYFLRNGGGPYDEKIANLGLDAFLEMLLLDNWTHGDLHPGNIMVRMVRPETYHIIGPLLHRLKNKGKSEKQTEPSIPTESRLEKAIVHGLRALADSPELWLIRLEELYAQGLVPQLVFIDAGLVTSLDAKNRRNFLDLFQAVAEFDGYRAGKLMIERCRRPDLAIDEETFALKMQHLVLSVKSKTFSLARIKISDILTDVLVAVRQHHVKLEGDFVNTVLSILLLEGIGRQLDPNMDLFKSALPILRQLGRQIGTRDVHVNSGSLLAMAKLWIWAEARGVAGEASQIDKWVRYDWLAPNI
ncbi:hypothetical protein CspeluHIS016_0306290 [Cutaneotrichosporon spelunceum]|uniref:ABC1-domain-containing protein n=1 Tax=Cutaneotrichosporon spelunceum TaxID=1672016 RepID=A0AAD3TTZ0_9TREE|nr:hypothetical protein CspeluHIS016_0306290 [Cutaneotrichosporon spelunceum]